MTNEELLAFLNQRFDTIDTRLDGIDTRLDAMQSDIDELKEVSEETRSGVNSLLEWAEDCGNAIKFPLPRVK